MHVEVTFPGHQTQDLIPVINYNPKLIIKEDKKDKAKPPIKISEPGKIIKKEKEIKKIEFQKIQKKDLLYHSDHGYLIVVGIDTNSETKAIDLVECLIAGEGEEVKTVNLKQEEDEAKLQTKIRI